MHKVKVVFGKDKISETEHEFETHDEVTAYLNGLADADGWLDYEVKEYMNYYRCPDCKVEWDDVWTCTCNDKCPECNKEIEPIKSEEID